MTVVEVLGNRMEDSTDQFPVGMRVLAVDDDPTCLLLLETLLRRCQYHVTSTKNAIIALKLLRENKNKFDLVISDVHMPDMDGFKLLELVGLEMDLPVIMLSVNDDPKMVMKGITHGACDYLLKPVRIEELQNIWQHVIRRRKIDCNEKNKKINQINPNSDCCDRRGSAAAENSDQNVKTSRKRKEQDEDEEEENENGHDNDDSMAQKKARVVWSVDLHGKFVAAVNQLGIDKAVPKKILDLMNVENLTRENVASHLQKYRLYLKRINCVANQQANMVAALGSADPSYLRMSSLSGIGNLQTLSVSRHFQNNNSFGPFQPGGIVSRMNSPAGLNLHSLPCSRPIQLGNPQNLSNSTNDQLFPSGLVGGGINNQNGIQGMKLSSINVSPMQNLTTLGKIQDQRQKLLDISNNALMLEANSMTVTPQGGSSQQFSSLPVMNNNIWSSNNNMSSTGASPITSLSSHDSLKDLHYQGGIFANMTPMSFQSWDEQSHGVGSSVEPFVNVDPSMCSTFNRNMDFNFCDPLQMKHDGMMEMATMNQQKFQNSRVANNVGSLEELLATTMNQKQDKGKLLDGCFSSNANNFSGGTTPI